VSLVHAYFNLLIVPTQVHSYSKFDLTLCVIPSVYVASSCSPIYIFSKVFCLQLVSLLGPRFII
jgi:hypothetical protein